MRISDWSSDVCSSDLSYSGLFKMFFDAIDKDALEGTPVLIGATARTARHSLVTEHALRPMFAYLKAVIVPTTVFAASEDFGSTNGGTHSSRVDKTGTRRAALVAGNVAKRAIRPVPGTIDNPEATQHFTQ